MTVDLARIRGELDVPIALLPDPALQSILDACTLSQDAACVTTTPGADLERALIRRVGREITARSIPLGSQTTEWGVTYIGRDRILEQLEAPYLRGGFA